MNYSTKKHNSLTKLNMEFLAPQMESEYISIQNKSQVTDFQATVLALMFVNLVTTVQGIIAMDITDIAYSAGFLGVSCVIFILKAIFPGKTSNYLILAAIFCNNLYRLLYIVAVYTKWPKTSFFHSGYTYAIFQIILLSRIHNIYYRIFGIIFCMALRFGLIIGFLEQSNVDIASLVRHVFVDLFVVYFFYSQEKTTRRIYLNFYDERDELSKFKELLEDFLPQCVTVIDLFTNQPLFSNKAFLKTFEPLKTEPGSPLIGEARRLHSNSMSCKPNYNMLQVDQASIRKMEGSNINLQHLRLSGTLKEVIYRITRENSMINDALCMRAYCKIEGETRSFEVILKGIRWNKTDAIAIILHETTDQERIITLKIADQNKDKVIAAVSHELRTPLNGIIGLIKMAQDRISDFDALKYLTWSKDNAELLLSLVNSHLDLQQIRDGKLSLNPARIHVGKVINDVIQLLQFQTKKKGVYLEADIESKVPETVVTDENRLKQILINLIGNAIKFTFVGGIKVQVCQDAKNEDCLQFCVADTGIGMKEEDMGKLFQMYGRLEEGRSVNKNGVGLGLIISNILARILGGVESERGIEVTSQYGIGSKFHFKVLKNLEISNTEAHQDKTVAVNDSVRIMSEENSSPRINRVVEASDEFLIPGNLSMKLSTYSSNVRINLLEVDKKHKSRGLTTIEALTGDQTTHHRRFSTPLSAFINITDSNHLNYSKPEGYILVVDDNPFNLLVAENQLKDMNFQVKTATGGHEAIEFVKSCAEKGLSIKVILMDCQMPVMSGYETSIVLKGMMEKGEVPYSPIFALSAGSEEMDKEKCMMSGMAGYLRKPLRKDVLLKELGIVESKGKASLGKV